MKILFFTRRFYPDIGGVEKHVLEISKRLASQGHTITIITQSQNSNESKGLFRNIKIIRIPKYGKQNEKLFIWKWLWKNRDLLKNADLIHCHDVFFWYFPFRFLFPQKPVFITFHGYESYPIKKKAIIVRKISEALSVGNICIGDFIKKWYYTKPTFVSYGAVDSAKFNPSTSLRARVQSSSIRQAQDKKLDKKESAVFLGRLHEHTGIKIYVKAYELIKKKYPKFELLVVGDGKYKQIIEQKVKVIGFQNNPEKYFRDYHFAFVSGYLSILEAFAAKRLVVAVYDNPLKEDYLKLTPYAKFMIIVKQPEEIAEKIDAVLHDSKQEKKMIEGAYNFVKNQTWEKLTTTYITLWNK